MKNKYVLNDLFDYGLKIYQIKGGFKFSLDSILLAEYVKFSKHSSKILDLCSGNAAIPLILSLKTKTHIDGIEIQKEIYDLAIKSIEYNNLANQITVHNSDVMEARKVLKSKKYDIITCNPPYFKVKDKNFINANDILAIARHEIKVNLENIFAVASSLLSSNGEFYLIHRASRLDEIIILGNIYHLRVKNVELIATKKDDIPYLAIVRCVKDAKTGIKINKIKNINDLKSYQNIFREDL